MTQIFNNIIIIGLGLIGGSLAMAIKQKKLAKQILAHNRSEKSLDFALKNQIIDGKFNFDQNLTKNDLIIIAAPLFAYEDIFQKIKNCQYQALITDIGSVKQYPENLYFKIFNEKNNFIPTHPIAGKESSGIENADPDLFDQKKLIITKFCQNQQNIAKISHLWQKIGSQIEILDVYNHDQIFCLISHLPQYISFKFKKKRPDNLPQSLKKHLRIENSNPKIWQEIFKLNKNNIDKYYKIFEDNYNNINQADIDKSLILEQFTSEKQQKLLQERLKILTAYLQIDDINKAKKFAGSGFNDFVNIKTCIRSKNMI
ncbi:prephenate dehydrogenase/arogenate dehydrogenase family protein [Rickettsiales bacterium]|nr:prephenate dehydrogenase/arogenate dehydrogenase family protein [Rickettsiales bacterium]